MKKSAVNFFQDSAEIIKELTLSENIKKLDLLKNKLISCINEERLIMIGGNGGSACDSDHFCAELVVRYKKNRKPVKCISLNSNNSILTASSNDYGYEKTFTRLVECYGNKNDIFIALSTSGNSKNIIDALNYANNVGVKTIGLLGNDGGMAKNLCENFYIVNTKETALIQQAHITILHYFAMEIEDYVSKKKIG